MTTGNRDGDSGPAQTVRVSRKYRCSAQTAFDAWTRPASLEQWFGPPGFRARVLTHELCTGGRWRLLMLGDDGDSFHHFGTFVEISPPQRLVFTWASEEQVDGWRDQQGNPTLVTVTFQSLDDGVEITITHERLASEHARRALVGGWTGSLTALSGFIEQP